MSRERHLGDPSAGPSTAGEPVGEQIALVDPAGGGETDGAAPGGGRTVHVDAPCDAGPGLEEDVGEIVALRSGQGTARRVTDRDVSPAKVSREVEVVDAEVQENSGTGGADGPDAGELDRERRVAADEPGECTDDGVEALGVADEEAGSGAGTKR